MKTYKEKNKLLLAGVMATGLLAYWLAIGPTVDMYRSNRVLTQQLFSAKSAPAEIARLSNELGKYDQAISSFTAAKVDWEQHLLQELSRACEQVGVRLIQLPSASEEKHEGYRVKTRVVKLEGSYKKLVQVLYALEGQKGIGRISSVQFVLEEDRRTRNTFLFAYMYIQNIEKSTGNE